MNKRLLVSGLIGLAVTSIPLTAAATYHIMVIQEVFAGFEQAPGAQYVVLRPQADLQTFVRGQAVTVFDAAGNPLDDFAAFCPMRTGCDLPLTSLACAQGGCPSPLSGNDTPILVATAWARDLFCVTPDLLATGALPAPAGRVCFADVGPFAGSCMSTGPVDCVAYGEYAGDNGIFGEPAPPLTLGMALASEPIRPSQCHMAGLDAAGLCVGGSRANAPCTGAEGDCPEGECGLCPDMDCSGLLDNAAGFTPVSPAVPRNFHRDIGALAGVAGDADGDTAVDAADVDEAVVLAFEAGMRCNAEAAMQGADANFDGRVNAADIMTVIQLVALG